MRGKCSPRPLGTRLTSDRFSRNSFSICGEVPVAQRSHSSSALELNLTVNGTRRVLTVEPWVTLLDLLREKFQLTGTKKGCDQGQCGACTVLVDGKRVNSCLILAVSKDGAEVTTIDGLAQSDRLHPLQAAFIERDGFQCGYCTPGQICSAVALISEVRKGDASFVTRDLQRIGPVEFSDE